MCQRFGGGIRNFSELLCFSLIRERMDGEMELESKVEEGFLRLRVDAEYEFDAPRYFDLGTEESPSEAQQAELWFETAKSYPPSPFIVKMNFGNKKQEIVDTILKFRDVDPFKAQLGVYAFPGSSLLCGTFTGAYDTFTQQDLHVDDKHANLEGTGFSNPSFMKPTAIQLARQNLVRRSKTSSWFPVSSQSRESSEEPSHSLLHAAKRQKITGGLICKVAGITQQSDLLHKNSKKECSANCDSHLSRMRLTIPREPMLETARRAKNFRAQRSGSNQPEGREGSTSTFKAHPLNRKILEAPSFPFPQKSTPKLPEFQEFKLKTSERAIKRSLTATTSAIVRNLASSSTVRGYRPGFKKLEYQPYSFSQKMLDNKKASIQKLETPNRDGEKFNFSTSKRCQPPNPLSELFNKLTLSSEAHPDNATHSDFPESIRLTTKKSKENVINPVHVHEG